MDNGNTLGIDKQDYDLSEISLSESWADARADTPTLGKTRSDSEDTLSNLSFDNQLEIDASDADDLAVTAPLAPASDIYIKSSREVSVLVTQPDESMMAEMGLPPGTEYKPPTVDFPRSPSQIKATQGPSFLPKEDHTGAVSEEDSSALEVNLHNGGARIAKKDDNPSARPKFLISQPTSSPYHSKEIIDFSNQEETSSFHHDGLDDYIEDFFLPLSHETIMSRQQSFRIKVQKKLESAAALSFENELDKFDAMLATYDENEELSTLPETNTKVTPPIPKTRKTKMKPEFVTTTTTEEEAPSLALDIDAIVKENAPNLMSPSIVVDSSFPSDLPDESMSNYFLPPPTLDKLYAVYESSNFDNMYCLSGELKNMLSSAEIEEIVANKEHLENFIDPKVMAALSWSLNEASLPAMSLASHITERKGPSSDNGGHISPREGKLLESKSSSLSHGFHSDLDSEDGQSNNEHDDGSSSVSCASSANSVPNIDDVVSRSSSGASSSASNCANKKVLPVQDRRRNGGNTIEDLGLRFTNNDVEWEDENGEGSNGGIYLARRDSKRCSRKKGAKNQDEDERVIEGLFVESKNTNPKGTLRRIKVPLNLAQDEDETENYDHLSLESPVDSSLTDDDEARNTKRKISVDDHLLSIVSNEIDTTSAATDVTSDVFHSIVNTLADDDVTIRSDDVDDDDNTFNIDTPDDMQDSIMEQLSTSDIRRISQSRIPELQPDDEATGGNFMSYRLGQNDIPIDLKAIQPYRRVLSHGGYYDAEQKVAIILFAACHLPDRGQPNYTYLMDHLFLYVLSTLEELVVDDYMIVYLHGSTPKGCMPTFSWLKRCYQLVNHRLRKNLKKLYLVHPTLWIRTVVALTKPFVSTKFSKKTQFVNTLSDLCLEIPTEHLVIPECVLQYDFDLKVSELKRRNEI